MQGPWKKYSFLAKIIKKENLIIIELSFLMILAKKGTYYVTSHVCAVRFILQGSFIMFCLIETHLGRKLLMPPPLPIMWEITNDTGLRLNYDPGATKILQKSPQNVTMFMALATRTRQTNNYRRLNHDNNTEWHGKLKKCQSAFSRLVVEKALHD